MVLMWRRRRALLTACALLPQTSLRLRLHGYGPTRDWLDRRHPRRVITVSEQNRITVARELAFVVRQAARLFRDATCLRKALVLRHLLAAKGIRSTIRFGARRRTAEPGSGFAFHAWVEVDGEVVSEEPRLVAGYDVLMDELPRGSQL